MKRRRDRESPRITCSISPAKLERLRTRAARARKTVPDLLRDLLDNLPEPPSAPVTFVLTDVRWAHRELRMLRADLRARLDRALKAYEDQADERWLQQAWQEVIAAIQAIAMRLPRTGRSTTSKGSRTP